MFASLFSSLFILFENMLTTTLPLKILQNCRKNIIKNLTHGACTIALTNIATERFACLKQQLWHTATDSCLARERSRVWSPGPVDTLYSSTVASFFLERSVFFFCCCCCCCCLCVYLFFFFFSHVLHIHSWQLS